MSESKWWICQRSLKVAWDSTIIVFGQNYSNAVAFSKRKMKTKLKKQKKEREKEEKRKKIWRGRSKIIFTHEERCGMLPLALLVGREVPLSRVLFELETREIMVHLTQFHSWEETHCRPPLTILLQVCSLRLQQGKFYLASSCINMRSCNGWGIWIRSWGNEFPQLIQWRFH